MDVGRWFVVDYGVLKNIWLDSTNMKRIQQRALQRTFFVITPCPMVKFLKKFSKIC